MCCHCVPLSSHPIHPFLVPTPGANTPTMLQLLPPQAALAAAGGP